MGKAHPNLGSLKIFYGQRMNKRGVTLVWPFALAVRNFLEPLLRGIPDTKI